jgi:hypothetical protein
MKEELSNATKSNDRERTDELDADKVTEGFFPPSRMLGWSWEFGKSDSH